jgi:hypothetical protein
MWLCCRCLAKFGFKLVSGLERDLVDSITQRSSRLVRYEDFVDALRVDIKYEHSIFGCGGVPV